MHSSDACSRESSNTHSRVDVAKGSLAPSVITHSHSPSVQAVKIGHELQSSVFVASPSHELIEVYSMYLETKYEKSKHELYLFCCQSNFFTVKKKLFPAIKSATNALKKIVFSNVIEQMKPQFC